MNIGLWLESIKANYSVNPYVFGVIYAASVFPFWFSLYKIIESLGKKAMDKVLAWGLVLAIATLAPFLYVALFGRNLPVWFWGALAAVIIFSVVSVIGKIKKRIVQ
jgi:hypothetical protein